MTDEQMLRHLLRANDLARSMVAKGRHPFAALLVAADGETVLLEQGNVDGVNHAEAVLARVAAHRFDAATLWGCTLVTTVEPCAMCAGTQYWAHIGRLVYGMSEEALLQITGAHPENPTLSLPCRELFARGQKAIKVHGPLAQAETEIQALHKRFWQAVGAPSAPRPRALKFRDG
jgi:tRNA(Arg) A34 adenosine deaminase TadA